MDQTIKQGSTMVPVMNAEEVNAYLSEVYPQLNEQSEYRAVEVWSGGCLVRLEASEKHLRPGGTVSGPSLFTLADIGGYVCALSHIGRQALTVTTNLNINFMRKAPAGAIDGRCSILKLGRSLMVFDVAISLSGSDDLVAHATGTYAIPHQK